MIDKAEREQGPAHVIEETLEKARGAGGEDDVSARYQGFRPGDCSIIVDCLTENNNRTVTDVRNCFTKTGSKLGPSGFASHMFDHLEILSFKGDNAEQVLEAMLEAEVDDVECNDGRVTLFAQADAAKQPPKAASAVAKGLPKLQVQFPMKARITYGNFSADVPDHPVSREDIRHSLLIFFVALAACVLIAEIVLPYCILRSLFGINWRLSLIGRWFPP